MMALLVAVIWTGAWLAYRAQWPTLDAFVAAVDHCPTLFCDFERYFYRQGQLTLDARQPIAAYLYSAPFAVALSVFQDVPIQRARVIWGVVQIALTLGVFAAPLLFVRGRLARPPLQLALYAFAFATCTAVLHNFKWGQVSVLMVCGILFSLALADRGRPVAAGLVLAIPIAVKYYAAVALIYFVFRRDWRALAACAAGLTAAAALAIVVLGPSETLAFQRTVNAHALAASRDAWVRADANSQFFAHVMGRWTGAASRGWVVAGYLIVLINVAFLWRICRTRPSEAARWAALFLLGSTPFWVDTSWPHYFIYLPALQLILVDALVIRRTRDWRWATVAACTAASIVAASTLAFLGIAGSWQPYGAHGYLFVANAAVLAAAYLLVGAALSASSPRAV